MCDEQELKTILDRVTHHSQREFGENLKDVILYGSYARGDQQEDSDIDIMVIVDDSPERLRRARWSFGELTSDIDLEYGICVSPVLESAETFEYWKEALPFFKNVNSEGVRLYA